VSHEKRVTELEAQLSEIDVDGDHAVYGIGGAPVIMTADEWRAYRREHPESKFISLPYRMRLDVRYRVEADEKGR